MTDGSEIGRTELTADSPFTLPGFFDELAAGRLLGAECSDCGQSMIPPRPACYGCGSRAMEAVEQPRTGEVVARTAVHRPAPAFEAMAPITLAVVELESGARLTGRVTVPREELAIGDAVRLTVREPTDPELAAALSYETEWPIHEFEPA